MWALGLTFYQLLTGRYPFEGATSFYDLSSMILTQEIDFSIIKDGQARECIKRMLDKDPETRATVDELLLKNWVTTNGKETIEVDVIDNAHKDTTKLGNMDRFR